LLPLSVRRHVDQMTAALKCSRTLDVEVDQYLLAGLETPTNHIFGELLANLTDSYNKWMLAYMAMDEDAQKYKPLYVRLMKACFRRMNGVWAHCDETMLEMP
jgi:hypothetical protein